MCRLCSSFVHKKLLNQLDKIRSTYRLKSSQRPVQDTDPLEEITDHSEIEIKEENLSGDAISTSEETKSDKQLVVGRNLRSGAVLSVNLPPPLRTNLTDDREGGGGRKMS